MIAGCFSKSIPLKKWFSSADDYKSSTLFISNLGLSQYYFSMRLGRDAAKSDLPEQLEKLITEKGLTASSSLAEMAEKLRAVLENQTDFTYSDFNYNALEITLHEGVKTLPGGGVEPDVNLKFSFS